MSYLNLVFLDACAILKDIQVTNPEAVISGGFLRDLFFGKQPKDLDIFISQSYDSYGKTIQVVKTFTMGYSTDYEIDTVQDALYFTPVDTLNVNIIEVNAFYERLTERTEQHDFDFCQVSFDGVGFYGLEKLQKVKDSGTVTLMHCENAKQYARSLRRMNKFKAKYPEFTFVDNFKGIFPEVELSD